jgi:adenylate kinase family enzyme
MKQVPVLSRVSTADNGQPCLLLLLQGVSTPLILKARGMTRSVCVSSLLNTAREARKYIDAGEMMPDHVVGDLLLEALLVPASAGLSAADLNLVVDGFPRTAVQVQLGLVWASVQLQVAVPCQTRAQLYVLQAFVRARSTQC